MMDDSTGYLKEQQKKVNDILDDYNAALERWNADYDAKIKGEQKWVREQLSQLGLSDSEIRDVLSRNAIGQVPAPPEDNPGWNNTP